MGEPRQVCFYAYSINAVHALVIIQFPCDGFNVVNVALDRYRWWDASLFLEGEVVLAPQLWDYPFWVLLLDHL